MGAAATLPACGKRHHVQGLPPQLHNPAAGCLAGCFVAITVADASLKSHPLAPSLTHSHLRGWSGVPWLGSGGSGTSVRCGHKDWSSVRCGHKDWSSVRCGHKDWSSVRCGHKDRSSVRCGHKDQNTVQLTSITRACMPPRTGS
jgi:hypothetical protein